jgi:hypothetical protein
VSLRNALTDVFDDGPVVSAPSVASAPSPVPRLAEQPPADLEPHAKRLWIVERRITAATEAIAVAEGSSDPTVRTRIGPLNEVLNRWLKMHGDLAPGHERDGKAEEAARWKAAKDSVIRKIKAGLERANA